MSLPHFSSLSCNKFIFGNPRFTSLPTTHSRSRVSKSTICCCHGQSSDSPSPFSDHLPRRWESLIPDVVKSAVKKWDDYVNSHRDTPTNVEKAQENEVGVWDWDRWKLHFENVDQQERILSILKSQLSDAVHREDYEDAAMLKVAIAAAAANDAVGMAISHLNRALEEEHYQDAAFIRDHAGAGLVGWWTGISEDLADPYGRIIHISAEHGRYVARSYSSRQLTTHAAGVPLFEIYFMVNDEGEYKQQAVYLKQNKSNSGGILSKAAKPLDISSLNPLNESTESKGDLSASAEDFEDDEERDGDADVTEGLAGVQNILQDMIPDVVGPGKVLKMVTPGNVDKDLISKVIEQITEEDYEENDSKLESVEPKDEIRAEGDTDDVELDDRGRFIDISEEQREMAVKIVIGGLVQKLSSNMPQKDLFRIPARLEKRSPTSFSFSIEKGQASPDRSATLRSQRKTDHATSDLAKVLINKEKIPVKVLKDVGELINLTLSQAQNRQPLSGSTIFYRIEIPTTSDPLNGLYIGAHGLYTSEIIKLRRKFGQWLEDDGTQKSSLEFYEYVEAIQLTGDPYVPAGQVAFRAKVGKRNQLHHKGIIPEELGVVARYKGQGRFADPGFLNPRWVDGELLILDGKYVKGGPVVGFVYLAHEYPFLVFFNRLRLQD